MAIASANGLLLKGGKEASHTNEALMALVEEALRTGGASHAVSLVRSALLFDPSFFLQRKAEPDSGKVIRFYKKSN